MRIDSIPNLTLTYPQNNFVIPKEFINPNCVLIQRVGTGLAKFLGFPVN